MDCIKLLQRQHQKVDNLFYELGSLGERAQRSKRVLVDQIIEMLSLHAAVEERILYPAIREEIPELRGMIMELLDEHHVTAIVMAQLAELAPEDPAFRLEVASLFDKVRRHVYEEERQLFPALRARWDAARREALGDELEGCCRALHDAYAHEGPKAFSAEVAH